MPFTEVECSWRCKVQYTVITHKGSKADNSPEYSKKQNYTAPWFVRFDVHSLGIVFAACSLVKGT
mgnify:CR=1 FL=1